MSKWCCVGALRALDCSRSDGKPGQVVCEHHRTRRRRTPDGSPGRWAGRQEELGWGRWPRKGRWQTVYLHHVAIFPQERPSPTGSLGWGVTIPCTSGRTSDGLRSRGQATVRKAPAKAPARRRWSLRPLREVRGQNEPPLRTYAGTDRITRCRSTMRRLPRWGSAKRRNGVFRGRSPPLDTAARTV